MVDEDPDSTESQWKYRAFMAVFWIALIGIFAFFFLDFFPTSLPVWGEWRFYLSK